MRELWISPSKIERYRCFLENEFHGFITEEKVLESIMGTSPYTPQANFGSAYHAVIEHGARKFWDKELQRCIIQADDMPSPVILSKNEVMPAVNYRNRYPNLKFENWVFHNLYIDEFKIVFIMRTDALNGLMVHENKTSTHPCDEESYFRSVQWKLYLDALDTNCVQYNHFHYYKHDSNDLEYQVDESTFRLYKYRGMKQEIKDLCYGLISFCRDRGIVEKLERQKRY